MWTYGMDTAVREAQILEGLIMSRIKSELKIMGINPILISSAFIAVFALLAVLTGDLLNLSCIGFEVIFPFYAAIAVGEWGRTRADDNYDVIVAQGKSLFVWVSLRFSAVFATISLYAVLCMAIVSHIRNEMPFWEMSLMYFPPAIFLSTLAALLNLHLSQEHSSTLTCGVVWLATLFIRSLLRLPGMEYVYLFIRYAGDQNDVWLTNKAVLLIICGIMWAGIYLSCRR
jgi:uncharacterized membrane protein YfcA